MRVKTKTYNYKDYSVELCGSRYTNGRIAIQMFDAETGEPVATVTINMPDIELAADEVCIKDYSENEGMLNWLLENELVTCTERDVAAGYVLIPIVKLTKELLEQI